MAVITKTITQSQHYMIWNRDPRTCNIVLTFLLMKKDNEMNIRPQKATAGDSKTHPMSQSFLAFATPFQIKKLIEHGSKTIGVDSTLNVTGYGHDPTTVVVQEETKIRLAVAFCLFKNKDTATYTICGVSSAEWRSIVQWICSTKMTLMRLYKNPQSCL